MHVATKLHILLKDFCSVNKDNIVELKLLISYMGHILSPKVAHIRQSSNCLGYVWSKFRDTLMCTKRWNTYKYKKKTLFNPSNTPKKSTRCPNSPFANHYN